MTLASSAVAIAVTGAAQAGSVSPEACLPGAPLSGAPASGDAARPLVASMRVRSADGASIVARIFHRDAAAANDLEAPVCLVIPAMGTRASFYEPLALALARRGYTAVTVDLRGQGESSERASRGSRFGYREIVEDDLPAIAEAVATLYPNRKLVVVGHSLGGQLAVLSVCRRELRAAGVVLVAAGAPYWRHWPAGARWKALLTVVGIAVAARVLPWYPGRRLGFGGDQPRDLMADWAHAALHGRFRSSRGGGSLEPESPERATPVLSVGVSGDLIAPEGAIDALVSYFSPQARTSVSLSPVEGADGWKRHFAWIKQPEAVVEAIESWWSR